MNEHDLERVGRDQHDVRGKSPQRFTRPRIPDATWYPAVARCKAEGRATGHVITALLDKWLAGEVDV